MFVLGIIEESLKSSDILNELKSYAIGDKYLPLPYYPYPVEHMWEYRIPKEELPRMLPLLESRLKPEWCLHAYDENTFLVILSGKTFKIPRQKDASWTEMLEYGAAKGVNKMYLENISLFI